MFKALASPKFQLTLCAVCLFAGLGMLVFALLRFVPVLEQFALGRDEPFWVLMLSIAALVIAALMGFPGALAYREVKIQNDIDVDVEVN